MQYNLTLQAARLYGEAAEVDKHNMKYRGLLRQCKQELLLANR